MGWFSPSSGSSASFDQWSTLSTQDQLNRILNDQSGQVHLIFKHSTRCGISTMAKKSFENAWGEQTDIQLWLLDLLNHRDLSNAIAENLKVVHQSPQTILIQNGQVLHHASHSGIDALSIQKIIE